MEHKLTVVKVQSFLHGTKGVTSQASESETLRWPRLHLLYTPTSIGLFFIWYSNDLY